MNEPLQRFVRRALAAVAIVLAMGSAVSAQTQVRVTKDQTPVWRSGVPTVLTTVNTGTVLDVIGRQGSFFVVRLPEGSDRSGEVGLIAVSLVEPVSGTTPGLPRPLTPPGRPSRDDGRAAARRAAPTARQPVAVVGFGQFSYSQWLAADTFQAVLGSAKAPMWGGGVQVRFGSMFVGGSAERFQKTGARVFVADGEVFNLGIKDTLRVVPVAGTVGYRHAGRHVAPYVGAGVGVYLYKETSDFSDPAENLSERFSSYHAVGGVEVLTRSSLRVALELQYTTVPGALGSSGASAAFNESDLGGVHGRVKIMIGK